MAGDSLERKLYRAGREVFAEGDHGNCAYIVEVGRIAISKDIEGREVVLGTIGPNGLFGEMALLDDAPRMASATAITDAVCVVLPALAVTREMERLDPLMRTLVQGLITNLRNVPYYVLHSLEAVADADTSGCIPDSLRSAMRRLAAQLLLDEQTTEKPGK